jgi:hypothetical protein
LQGLDWEWLAMDGAMTNASLVGTKVGKKPTDRGQLGTTRSVRTDGGVPLGGAVEGANRHDFKMVQETLTSLPLARPTPTPEQPQGMCREKGDDVAEVRERLAECGFTAHIQARGEEARAITREAGYRARRWVVERTHSGMHRFRRLLVRCDKQVHPYLAWLHLACASITYRQSGLLG